MYNPTKKDINTVMLLKEKGATDRACYDALGISRSTFNKYKKTHFNTSIKKGKQKRAENHYNLAVDALALRLQQRTVTEKTTVTRDFQGSEQVETKEVEKVIQPADTLIMFTLVNKSSGEWQSINKVEQKTVITPPKIEIEVVK